VFKRDTRYVSGKHTVTEHYYAGGYEKIVQTQGRSRGLVEHKYHLMGGNIVITHRSNGTKDTHYLHKDTQGSVSLITNESGSVIAQYIYDPFGKQTTLSTNSLFAQAIYNAPSHQGYTGHHSLNDVGIIHMNGRIYDPTLGRFLQADPFVQAPTNSQSYNRYSYLLNNPLSYTDPSGYFFKYLFKKLNKVLGDFAPFVGFALMFIPGTQGFGWAITKGFVAGGIATGSLKGALVGAFSAAAFYGIGQHFKGLAASNSSNAVTYNFGGNMLTSGQIAGQIASHALVGGVISVVNGGKFGHGFFSAGGTKGLGGALLPGGENLTNGEIAEGTIISALIGGTASIISGGKFANGARTASFQYLFNQVANSLKSCSGQMCRNQKSGKSDTVDGAANDFKRNYQDMRDANTIGADKYFHCKANCEATQRGPIGEETAEVISDSREWVDQNIKGDPASASQADQAANIYGRQQAILQPNTSCQVICQPYRTPGLDQKY
jgi:RHS repeat-associated protein